MTRLGAAVSALILAAAPGAAAGQALAERITGGGDGEVLVRFAVREGVEICDRGIRVGDNHMIWQGGRGVDVCDEGPAEAVFRVRDGEVTRMRILRLGEEPRGGTRDLGTAEARAVVEAVVALARDGRSGRDGELLVAAVIADAEESWRDLLDLAEDRSAPSGARKSALFWVGQEAARAATDGLSRVARDDDEDQEVRDAAIFALSQRPAEESMPILMELARTAEQAKTRKTAFFWLAQVDDPRVADFFRDVLRGGGGA